LYVGKLVQRLSISGFPIVPLVEQGKETQTYATT